MFGRIAALAIAAVALAPAAALAETTIQGQPMPSTPATEAGESSTTSPAKKAETIPQEIRDKLTAHGFTDVEVVPGSYLVIAKDEGGDPVMMLIAPNGIAIVTEQ